MRAAARFATIAVKVAVPDNAADSLASAQRLVERDMGAQQVLACSASKASRLASGTSK
jgi:hypothetical protein